MSKTTYPGIDYSTGVENRDSANGVHYGVISQNDILQAWCDSSEPDYGKPHCPKCGNEAMSADDQACPDFDVARPEIAEYSSGDYYCKLCNFAFDGDRAFGDEPLCNFIKDDEYQAADDSSGDVWVFKSPYYTFAQFCSPCAPGAGYLGTPCDDGPKTYCFGPDFFDGGIPPYDVYSVETRELVRRAGFPEPGIGILSPTWRRMHDIFQPARLRK